MSKEAGHCRPASLKFTIDSILNLKRNDKDAQHEDAQQSPDRKEFWTGDIRFNSQQPESNSRIQNTGECTILLSQTQHPFNCYFAK